MPDYRTIVIDNDASRERLKGICGRLAEVDLRRMIDADGQWTVAAKLAHFAFWDHQALCSLQAFERASARRGDVAALIARTGEWLPAAAVEAWRRVGVDWDDPLVRGQDRLNDAALPAWLAMAPHVALREAVNSAELLDDTIGRLPTRLVKLVLASHNAWSLEPWKHRTEHLDEIERALAESRSRESIRYAHR